MKKTLMMALTTLFLSSLSFAGGKGGLELALSSYGGLGVTAAKGYPLHVTFLRSKGLYTYGELEVGAGYNDEFVAGADASAGLLFPIDKGISIYVSAGPAIGIADDAVFDIGAEIGANVDVNKSLVFVEVGTHPTSNYVSVGVRF
ncbi:hypothetical protein [Reinekea thalattae]|uniref:Outer membrane beta-barrel protein n=1 Tax=Reinekea thalattae TaxID=2593301 RepID=A0A5C8Z7H9_9GAMM|nr:hypothetical protein [Reinekea thalattae]TXR53253.1 hypothetical protein FME95_01380 [Reinekea thalattae]